MIAAADPKEMLDRLRPQLSRLPIFPLQRAFLFPSALLPLYVFEPRYREMTAACLAAGGAMAVATLLPGFEAGYHGRPPVRPVAGAGLVVAHRQNTDGTYNILLQGVGRVRIDEELPPERSFREVRATLLEDSYPPGYDPADARQALLSLADRLFDQIAARSPEGADDLRALCHAQQLPGQLTDVLGATLLPEPGLRQQLLETPDVAARLDLVADEIARLLSRGEPGRVAN
jgi:uncharacterized protein